MRNLLKYPLTTDEAIEILVGLNDEVTEIINRDLVCGNMTPHCLRQVAEYLLEHKEEFDAFNKKKPLA